MAIFLNEVALGKKERRDYDEMYTVDEEVKMEEESYLSDR